MCLCNKTELRLQRDILLNKEHLHCGRIKGPARLTLSLLPLTFGTTVIKKIYIILHSWVTRCKCSNNLRHDNKLASQLLKIFTPEAATATHEASEAN